MKSFRDFIAILMAMFLLNSLTVPVRAQQADKQQAADKAKREAEEKAKKRAAELEKNPSEARRIFAENPTLQTKEEEQVGPYTVQTYTRYESFEIKPPTNGETTLSLSVIRMGIQETVRSDRAADFAREFRAATSRLQQEDVLKKYHPSVASLKAPDSLFDPASFLCPQDRNSPPEGFPKSERTKDAPGYMVITRFGVNAQTRMGPPVTDLTTFQKQLPKAEKAIAERLKGHMDFRDRAEVARVLHQLAETGELDGLVAKEDYTKNYPFRRWSTGSGQPLEWVWFKPDARGEQERGIRIISRFSGKVFWINYSCGLNIDEIYGCTGNMVVPGVISTTVVENYFLCDTIEVAGFMPDALGRYVMRPGDKLVARVKARSTGPAVKQATEDWKWRLGAKALNATSISEVSIAYNDLQGGETNLTVESTTAQKTVQTCSVRIVKFVPPPQPEILCSSLTAKVVGKTVEVMVPLSGDPSLIRRIELVLDGRALPENEVRFRNGAYSFRYDLIPDDGLPHVVTARLHRTDGTTQECTDKTPGNTIPGRDVPCPECKASANRTKGIKDDQQDIVLRSNIKNPANLEIRNPRWTMRYPGQKDPKVLCESEECIVRIADMPHDSKNVLIPGKYVVVFNADYVTPDGKLHKFAPCPQELEVAKKGWNKAWLLLLALALIPLLLLMHGKKSEPYKTASPGCASGVGPQQIPGSGAICPQN